MLDYNLKPEFRLWGIGHTCRRRRWTRDLTVGRWKLDFGETGALLLEMAGTEVLEG